MMTPGFRSAADILHSLPEAERRTLYDMLGVPSGDDRVLIDTLLDPARIAAVMSTLSPDGLDALQSWVREGGMWHDPSPKGRVAQGIRELASHGLVFHAHWGPRRRIPLMPWQLMAPILSTLWKVPWDRLSRRAGPREMGPSPLWSPLIHDIFQMLSFGRQEPLLLTNQHSLYRRVINKMAKLLWERKHMAPEGVADYLMVALDQMGFFEVVDSPYRLEIAHQAEALLDMSPSDAFSSLGSHIFNPSRQGWPVLIWAALASLIEPHQTLDLAETTRWMMDMGLPSAGNKYLVDHAVRDLIVFDMLDVTGPGQYRLTGWAYAAMRGQFERAESRSALVQPTGEIMVPPATPLQERWLIDGLATRVKSDRVSTYRIDRASVRRGINQSLTATRHAEALEALTRNPLPDNVRVNLEDWYRLYQRHQIIEATFIHSLSAQDSRSIETILGSDAVERLTETDIAIPQSRIKNVVKKLDKAGSPILPEIKRPSQDATVTAQPDYPDANQLWPLHLFDEASPPDQSVTEIRQLMAAAMRNGQALSLIFHMPGESRTHMATVVPVSLQDKWIQVYLIEDRRYLMVDWGQILSAEMLPSPV